MALEFDFLEGFDIASVASSSQDQVMQSLRQMGPKSNRGFIIYQATTPDVASNARFARYIQLVPTATTPTLKVYNLTTLTWDTLPVAAGSVIAASIGDGEVTYNTKIGGFAAAAADAFKLLQVNAAGTRLQVVSFASLIAGSAVIPLSALTTVGGGPHYFSKWNAAGTLLGYEAFDSSFIGANTMALTKLVNGSGLQLSFIVRANPTTGVIELVSNSDKVSTLLAARSVRLSTLDDTAAAVGDRIVFVGADWTKHTPLYAAPTVGGTTIPDPTTGALLSRSHGFNPTIPKTIKCYLVCTTIDRGYAVGDVVDANNLMTVGSGGEARAGVAVHADATNIYAAFGSQGAAVRTYKIVDKATFAVDTVTPASWNVMFYATL